MPHPFDVLGLLAGLGLFLLGMDQLESGISRLSQSALRRAIRRATDTRLKSITTGVFTTALVQSSSVVSLLVLAFSAAGFLGTGSAIAVIMGTNLGSTLNPWIVAVFGFTFSIEKFALPFIALGGISLIVKKQAPLLALSGTVLMGLGLLFLGLDFMKEAVDELAASLDPADVPRYGVFVYLVSGVVFTALVQASSATLAVVLTAVNSGLLGFQEAAAVVIGANIGTTVTVILGAVGGTAEKKRVAASHLIFNSVTAIIALVLLPLISAAMMHIPLFSDNSIYGIAAFHTLFNALGLLIFYPFISFLAQRLSSWFREPAAQRARFLNRAALGTAETSFPVLARETMHLLRESMYFNSRVMGLPVGEIFRPFDPYGPAPYTKEDPAGHYERLKTLGGEIFAFGAAIQKLPLSPREAGVLDALLHAARGILSASKNLKDIGRNLDALRYSGEPSLEQLHLRLQNQVRRCVEDLLHQLPDAAPEARHGELMEQISDNDRRFIDGVLAGSGGPEQDARRLGDALMANRYVTQSCRLWLESAAMLNETGSWFRDPSGRSQ